MGRILTYHLSESLNLIGVTIAAVCVLGGLFKIDGMTAAQSVSGTMLGMIMVLVGCIGKVKLNG